MTAPTPGVLAEIREVHKGCPVCPLSPVGYCTTGWLLVALDEANAEIARLETEKPNIWDEGWTCGNSYGTGVEVGDPAQVEREFAIKVNPYRTDAS